MSDPVSSESGRPAADLLIEGAAEVLTCVPGPGDPAGRLAGVSIAISGEKILGVGPPSELAIDVGAAQVIDARGKIVAPGFVDPHTHLVFGGSRVQEYAARMTMDAAQVSALGIPTGIGATVAMTRSESLDQLTAGAARRVARMLRHGTTTIESKSGYGLSLAHELKMLAVNAWLQANQPVDIVSTFLGAHDFPPEVPRGRYLEALISEMIPLVAQEGRAEFCDVYCDEGYYTVAEARRILEAGQEAGLVPKIHVDAYADIGGAAMAAELGVVSADHLNYTQPEAMKKIAEAGVTGVVMPGLDFSVRHPRPFNAREMFDQGMSLALATDLCPGCWVESMQIVMQLACRLYQFSPAEALYAATMGGAQAVGRAADRGSIEPGKLADLQIWDIPSFEDVIYRIGNNAVEAVIKRGQLIRIEP